MEAKTNYTLVGTAVLILTAGLLATVLWLSVGFDKKKYHTYTVYVHEAVSGLSEESPIKFNGVQVGFVKKIMLNRRDPRQVKILLDIEDKTPVTTSTTATLITQGITGTTYVGLEAKSANLIPLQKFGKEPYPVIPSRPSLFKQLDSVLKEVSENINSLSLEIKQIFDKENTTNLKKTLANLQSTSEVIAQNKEAINRSLKNTDVVINNMAAVSKFLPQVVNDLKLGVNKISRMATDIAQTSHHVNATLDSSKTAIDKFAQQTLPPSIILLRRLDNIASNLEKVSAQMRQNPSIFIRGTTPLKAGPGE